MFVFLEYCMRTWFSLELPFYSLSDDRSPVILMIILSPQEGCFILDGTKICLTVLTCVSGFGAFMILCASLT